MTMIRIFPRNEINTAKYHNLLGASKNNLIYSEITFLDAISEFTNSKLYFAIEENVDHYLGVLPFCVYEGTLGPVINSLPFYGSNGGVIERNIEESNAEKIVETLFQFAKEIHCASMTLIESPLQPLDDKIISKFNYFDSRIGLINYFDSDMTSDTLLQSFEDPRPRNIRKAEREGVKVSASHSPEAIKFLAETHIENMNSIGGLSKSKDFFNFFLKKLPQNQWIILEAYWEDRRVASLLLLFNSNVIEYFTPATIPEYRNLQAQALLIFEGMNFAIEHNLLIWNWGGTWGSQQGVYDFKRKWGSIESTYRYFTAVFDETILDRNKEELLEMYPNFFVVPFSQLKV